jgi:hypothetical protein
MAYIKKEDPKKRGRKPGQYFLTPRNNKLIQRIIRLREDEGLPWRVIGPRLGLSHQAPYLLYKRWRLGKRTKPYVNSSKR